MVFCSHVAGFESYGILLAAKVEDVVHPFAAAPKSTPRTCQTPRESRV